MSPCLVCTYSRNEALEHFESIQYVKHVIICNTRHENLFYTNSYDIMRVSFDKRFSAGMCSSACGSHFQHVSVSGLLSKAADGFHQLASVPCRECVVACNFVKLYVGVLFVICAELDPWWQSQTHYLMLSQQCYILQAFSNWSFGSFKTFAHATRLHCIAVYSCTLYCLQKILTFIIALSLNINFAEFSMAKRLSVTCA